MPAERSRGGGDRRTGRRVATVDLGTNTVRLLVVDADGERWRTLHQAQQITRLGEGQASAGRLLEAPMRRTADAVAALVATAERLGAREIRIVATSAVREATNRADLIGRVLRATGRPVEVISGDDEARLTLAGVAASLPELASSFSLVDIGGGSTEIVVARQRRAVAAVSLKLGVVRLAERFTGSEPVGTSGFDDLRASVAEELTRDVPAEIAGAATPALVGTAGTITTLAALDLGLAIYDPDRVHGHVLDRPAVERLLARLAPLGAAEREALPGVERGRGDLLIPGIAILLTVMARLGHETVIVSDRGLREGILLSLLAGTARGAPSVPRF